MSLLTEDIASKSVRDVYLTGVNLFEEGIGLIKNVDTNTHTLCKIILDIVDHYPIELIEQRVFEPLLSQFLNDIAIQNADVLYVNNNECYQQLEVTLHSKKIISISFFNIC